MYMKFHESDFSKSIFAEECFSKSLDLFGIWGQGYCLGCPTEKPVPPKLEEKRGKGCPSFASVASLEEKRMFVVHMLSRLGAVCSKYSKHFAPPTPSSRSPLSWCRQEQGDISSAGDLGSQRQLLTQRDPTNPYPCGCSGAVTQKGYFTTLRAAGNYLTLGRGGVWAAEADGPSPHPAGGVKQGRTTEKSRWPPSCGAAKRHSNDTDLKAL